MTDWLDQIDFCIKTYLRPQACENLVASIRRFYPAAAITTNDDPCIAKGRNELVKRTKRPFLLMLDDDFLFTEETSVEKLFHTLCLIPCHVSAGGVMDCQAGVRVLRNSGGKIRWDGNTLFMDTFPGTYGTVDVVPNFFIARRGVFKKCQWRFGIAAEHVDFFLQLKELGITVFQDKRVTIDHDLDAHESRSAEYKAARWHGAGPTNVLAFMNHWGVDQVLVNGKVAHNRPVFVTERQGAGV